MEDIKVSVVIPCYNDPYLQKTIDSLLENSDLGEKLEIIPVLNGYWTELRDDPHVTVVHLGRNRGMREAINIGVSVARGEFILRTDAHCMFAPRYDRVLSESCPSDAIMTATRYFLDPVRWEKIDMPPVNYEKLVIQGGMKFAGMRWHSRDEERKDHMIDETMGMQGSMWIMPKAWWKKVIINLQSEGYGPLYQDSHEMIFKTWKAGGKMLLNKNTWYAHKHRGFSRTHNYGSVEAMPGWKYTLETWRDYYDKEIRPKWKI